MVAEILVGSLEEFAHKAGLSEFFVSAVIVAIVGNAAEHGGAIVVAHRGKIALAAEIALVSIRRSRVEQLVEEGSSGARRVRRLLDRGAA